MSKCKALIATLLLIPSFAFATNQCANYTDQDFRDMLTTGPQTIPWRLNATYMEGTMRIEYHKDGILEEHFSFGIPKGTATIDLQAKWDVSNTVLYFHLISIKHNDTHNKKINKDLDDFVKEIKATPNSSIPVQALGLCDGKRSVNAFIPLIP